MKKLTTAQLRALHKIAEGPRPVNAGTGQALVERGLATDIPDPTYARMNGGRLGTLFWAYEITEAGRAFLAEQDAPAEVVTPPV